MVPLQIQIRLALAVVRPRTRHCPEQRRGLEHPRYVGLRTHTHPAPTASTSEGVRVASALENQTRGFQQVV